MSKQMREVYTQTLIDMAKTNKDICVLEADLMKATGTGAFKELYPERTFNVGVAEANMVGVAAGLSALGKIPYAATFGIFASRRVFDQFFLSANYAQLNVNLVGTDPGVSAAFNGGTHMPFEDAGMMRMVPKLVVFEPADAISLESLVRQSAAHKGSTYMRLHRKPLPDIYKDGEKFELGKGKILEEGSDVTIIATGGVAVGEAIKAHAILKEKGVSARLIDMHTIKPIDKDLVIESAKKTKAIVTVENHQIVGALGSSVAEVLCENHPTKLKRVGVEDMFGEVGTIDYLKERFGITAENIVKQTMQVRG
jgi:transketolase